jgi:CRISPR-associated endonuclease/helicase Cas3
MNVMFVSQCDKRALTETRRVLDQFAERRGDRTWQTPITQDGLQTLHRMLRKTARKNTAVACHWIRGTGQTELLWVVGDRSHFNAQGAVPTNTTKRNILRQQDENTWHHGQLIGALADLSGLLHDLGKAMNAFQDRLRGKLEGKNLVRHEWASVRLFEAFVGRDDDATWLTRLANPTALDDALWINNLHRDSPNSTSTSPFKTLAGAPLAQALAWLVVTHHRLPQLPWTHPLEQKAQAPIFRMSELPGQLMRMGPAWNEDNFEKATPPTLEPYWRFDQGLPVTTTAWRQRASRVAKRLQSWLDAQAATDHHATLLANPFVMHLSRLSLMLADHHYSSLENASEDIAQRVTGIPNYPLWANTLRRDGEPNKKNSVVNQTLDEHLVGVAQHSAEIARFLPRFEQHLPRLVRNKRLKQRSQDERYRWQDKSAELAQGMRERAQEQGGFIVNMASTGCGKTLANARIMNALADPALGMRCAFAMGLRTLTLQTGKAFRDLLGLGDDDLAIRVGGSASRALFEHHETMAENTGSASRQALDEEDAHVSYDGDVDAHPLLRRAVADPEVRKLLLAPLLVCTIDHLTPATESQRGGRQIAPMLRLMSGDLVLDEPDDFDLADLPALTRLVHWAGLLGARVLLSSATLPPALVQGLFEAYRNGRHHFQRNCGARPSGTDAPPAVCCAWVDEFHQQAQDCPDGASFEQTHATFAARRHSELAKLAAQPRRRAMLLPLTGPDRARPKDLPALAAAVTPQIMAAALALHRAHHSLDPHAGGTRRVSFGLVRMANIEPLFEVALALFQQTPPEGVQVHLCVYHSRHPLLVRSAIERQLDQTLQRHNPEAVFQLPDIRARLDASAQTDHLFIVLGSPVTEVGRDHDYDWAVVEPSSMRSLIQLAGRVRRHRPEPVSSPNILVLSRNLRSFTAPGQAAFCKPGFEADDGDFRLRSNDLNTLLTPAELDVIDARPRITAPTILMAQERLVDLEHARLRAEMLPRSKAKQAQLGSRARAAPTVAPAPALNASTWWQQPAQDTLLSAVLPQQQPFRKAPTPNDITLVLLPDEDGTADELHEVTDGARKGQNLYQKIDKSKCHRIPDAAVAGERIAPWGVPDYMDELSKLATAFDKSLRYCAERFGTVAIRPSESGWRYHPALGFAKKKD